MSKKAILASNDAIRFIHPPFQESIDEASARSVLTSKNMDKWDAPAETYVVLYSIGESPCTTICIRSNSGIPMRGFPSTALRGMFKVSPSYGYNLT